MTLTHRRRYLLLAQLVAFVLVLWVQLPHLLDPYAVEDDFRNLYWVHRYRDPELFPHGRIDHLEKAAPGYAALFRVGTIFVTPILFSKLLAFPLMLVAVYYVFRIVEQMAGRHAALLAGAGFAVFILTAGSEISVASGLQRSFALPLLAAFAYYLMRERYAIAAGALFLTGIIYIPSLPAMAVAYVLSCLRNARQRSWRSVVRWRALAYLLIVLVAVVILLLPAFARHADRALSTATGDAEPLHFLRDPTYASGGRVALFIIFPFVGRGGIVALIRTAIQLSVMGLFALVVTLARRKPVRKLHPVFLKLLAGGCISFVLAWLAFILTSSFFLYLPSRHTQTILFLSLLVYVSANAPEAWHAHAPWLRQHRRQLLAGAASFLTIALLSYLLLPVLHADYYQDEGSLRVARWLLFALMVVLAVLAAQVARRRHDDSLTQSSDSSRTLKRLGRLVLGSSLLVFSFLYVHFMGRPAYTPSDDMQQLFSYVRTLPKDALLAGDPCTLDSIPLYARRTVLFTCERHGHLSPDSIRAALSAYYAAEWEEVRAFCQEHDVSHLVVNAESFSDEIVQSGEYFYEPYASQIADTIRNRPRYVLAETPVEERLFEAGDFYVVACQDDEGTIAGPANEE